MTKKILLFLLAIAMIASLVACAADSQDKQTIIIEDMMGREIEIPGQIDTIFCIDPMSSITLYTVAPDMLAGWNYALNEFESAYILEEYRDLPVFGMGGSINFEAALAAKPDIALLTGTLSDGLVEKADMFAEKLGIPVVILDNALTQAPSVFALLGQITGNTKQAAALSSYATNAIERIAAIDEPTSIYYANGVVSLDTSAKGTAASQLFDMVQADNVCDLQSESGDRITVTKEHIIDWNPQFIFVNGEPTQGLSGSTAAQNVLSDPHLANVQAVKDGNVISIPKAPFAWVDRPRSVNLLIGIGWLGSILYPDNYSFSNEDIRNFYALFYHVDLTDTQIDELLNQ
ncbi:MAG: ABC transporter substrate-binding protein [Clostridia bacterium]|jgi:iron complex transport system substrate-binding protein|nr:ABC transporter substrate-binding protein [Clostridia bacterium]MBT7123110.1 ABC transporter substrate-binding protein [Clostridia bacterium]